MKTLIVIAALSLSFQAQAGGKNKSKECKTLQQLVKTEGIAVIDGNTYVASSNMCASDEESVVAYKTVKGKFCKIGFKCKETNMYKK